MQSPLRSVMSDPIIGLIVAVGLGIYLVWTLLSPERF
ncbi:MAG: K(+)-transporting ATPase subunit F [Proteobacteria bacterium]|nr:K(+)-transporting ATPase subunit F [Pseudomonadota bacterium]